MTSSTSKTKEALKDNIIKYRKKLNLTQVQLGVWAGLTVDTVRSIEMGRRVPSLDTLCKLADALKVEPYELLK